MQKNLTIKELPDTERPYEKCLLYGAGSLSDAELISVIIRTGSRGERCVDLAHRILNAGPDGLLNLIRLDTEQLTGIRGIGPVKAVQLKCIGELARRIAVTQRKKQIADCLNPHLTSFSKLEVNFFQFFRNTFEIQLIHTWLLYGFS